jgi:fructosamine-3-kinase
MTDKDYIPEEIKKLGLCSTIHNIKNLSGGCISQAFCYTTDRGDLFIKV